MMAPRHVFVSENSRAVLMASNPENDVECRKFTQFLAAFIGTLSALSMGMCLSWSSAAIQMLRYPGAKPYITESQGAWIGSLITLGACLGAIPMGSIATFMGPKRTLLFLALPLYASWNIIAYCPCVQAIYVARFLAGLSIGGISVAAPLYVAELAHTSIRGTLGTFFQMQITIGLLIQYILGGMISEFKLLAQVSSIFPVIFVVIFNFMPESPVYLCSKGDTEGCRKSLNWLRGEKYNVDEEVARITEDIKESSNNKARMSDLINCRATLRGLIISLGLMVFQQLSGINAVLFYTGNIFAESGSTLSPNTCAIVLGTVQVLATILSTILVDKAGRKILLFLSDAVMCICLLILGVYFNIKKITDLSSLSVIPLASVALFIIMFSIGFGPIPWMMMGEIFNSKTKGLASSISASFNWILAFTVTNQFQNMVNGFGIDLTFGIFGVICAVGAMFVVMLVPETKGKQQDEIERVLSGRIIRFNAKDVETSTTML